MRQLIPSTTVVALCMVGLASAPAATSATAASRHVTNAIKQQLFLARLAEIRATQHRRFRWAMTFKRISDGELFHYEVYDDSPVAKALGFKERKHAQEGVQNRIVAAPDVLLMTEPYRGRNYPEAPKNVVVGCFVIDKGVPNHLLLRTSRSSLAQQQR